MGEILDREFERKLRELDEQGLRRRRSDLGDEPAPGGRALADFRSNDYLGLAADPEVVAAARDATARFGAGGRSARLLGGGSPLAAAAEAACADWLGCEAALLFPTGFQANLGVLGALAGRGAAIFSDALDHASIVDGARLSRARVEVHAHLDLEQLERNLAAAHAARARFVVTESVFSVDGDAAPLAALLALCERHDAWLIVDEAHAAGLLGPSGAGAWEAAGLPARAERLAARVVTGGKALGVAGAFVAGSAALVELLANRARSFVFTTAPPPAVAGALIAAIGRARALADRRRAVVAAARELARALDRPEPAAAIVPIPLPAPQAAVAARDELAQRGFAVAAIRPPTVPAGGSRLRLSVHAHNVERGEIARLLPALRDTLDRVRRSAPAPAKARAATPFFVVGTDTGVGKTVVSALLLRAARKLGPAAYWKPVQTGGESDTEAVRALAEAEIGEIEPEAFRFPLPASPHAAASAAGAAIDPVEIGRRLDAARRAGRERLIVELAGGLLVPWRAGAEPFLQADWLARDPGPIVLVARSGLGTLNHTLLTLEALRRRRLEVAAIFVVGAPHRSNVATLAELGGIRRLFEIEPFEPLCARALAEWLERNDLAPLLGAMR